MSNLPLAPFCLYAICAIILCLWRDSRFFQYLFSIICGGFQIIISCFLLYLTYRGELLYLQIGDWPAPFGISVYVDILSSIMLLISAIMFLGTTIYSKYYFFSPAADGSYYYPLTIFLMMGGSGAFVTADLFNLYVCFEIMLIASFGLLTFGKGSNKFRGMLKYVVFSLLASLFFLLSIALIYGQLGSLNFAKISLAVASMDKLNTPLLTGFSFLLISFAIKSSAFPFFQWLPHSYPNLMPAVLTLFASVLTKAGVYSFMRVSTLLLQDKFSYFQEISLIVATLTMFIGVIAAVVQMKMKNILANHIISQIGYILMGIAIFTKFSLSGAIFYLVHNILAKGNLLLVQGVVERYLGTDYLKDQGHILKEIPWLAFSFLVSAIALSGIPPFSGFFAKYLVLQGALQQEHFVVAFVALVTSMFTLYSMTKIWNESFLKKLPRDRPRETQFQWHDKLPIFSISILSLVMGVAFTLLYPIFEVAGEQLTRPEIFRSLVLGDR